MDSHEIIFGEIQALLDFFCKHKIKKEKDLEILIKLALKKSVFYNQLVSDPVVIEIFMFPSRSAEDKIYHFNRYLMMKLK